MRTIHPKLHPSGVTRLLQPPVYLRSVRVPNPLVAEKLVDGWRIDPNQEDHFDLHRTTPGRHEGKAAFVAASGPSMGLFPIEAIHEYTRHMVRWATNNAWEVVNGAAFKADYLVIMDDRFFRDRNREVLAYLAETEASLVSSFNVNKMRKWQKVPIPMNTFAKDKPPYRLNEYFHGKSSGVVAVQMAMHAGCNPIYLLGHDLTAHAGRTHGNGCRSQRERDLNYPQGRDMIAGYELLADHARQLGVEIVNLSPISALTCFSKPEPQETLR